MARSRNIKPGFYKNEDLAECSIWARFIFPGLWMLADRQGRLEDRPKRIKGELLPFDSQDVEPLLHELASKKDSQGIAFIVRYKNSDGAFIQISKFLTHQSPHYSEKSSVIKPPIFPELCGHDEGLKPENSEKTPIIKRGSQPPDSLIPDCPNPSSSNPDSGKMHMMTDVIISVPDGTIETGKNIPDCPYAKLVEIYHETLPLCRRVLILNNGRRGLLRARWREMAKKNGASSGYSTVEDGLAWWRNTFFTFVAESHFLTGRSSPTPGREAFVADLEWLMRPQNFSKVIEGKYP